MWKMNRHQRKFFRKIFSKDRFFFSILLAILCFFTVMVRPILFKKKFFFQKNSFLKSQIKEVTEHNHYLEEKIVFLETDLESIEAIARKKLNMKKKDEIVYK